MKKIIILIVSAVILLMGAETILAKKEGKPKEKERQKQKEMLRAERKEKAREEAREEEREEGKDREAVRERPEASPERQPLFAPPQRPAMQMFGRWLDELTKAYQENDRERMGQLIKKMHKFRQKSQMGRAALGGPLQGSARGWRPEMEEGQLGRFGGLQKRQQGFQPGRMGMGRMGRPQAPMLSPEEMEGPQPVMPREGIDQPTPDLPPRGMRGARPQVPDEGMGGWGRGFGGRGMGMGGGRGMMGMGRGMGMGMGRGMGPPSAGERPTPGPWCPWWRYQQPEMD
jgi:hypothetical protein